MSHSSPLPRQKSYIVGDHADSRRGRTFTTIDPARGELLAEVEVAGTEEVERGVEAPSGGLANWARMRGSERGHILSRAAQILRARNSELAELETRDTGKPIQETSLVDIQSGADCLEYYAGLALTITGDHIDLGDAHAKGSRRNRAGDGRGCTACGQRDARVWINHCNITPVAMPFGGPWPRERKAAIAHCTEMKSVYVAPGDIDSPMRCRKNLP